MQKLSARQRLELQRSRTAVNHGAWIGELWRCRKYHEGVGTRETCRACYSECCKAHKGTGTRETCPVCARNAQA